MSDDKYPREWLTEEEARLRHSDCEFVDVYSIFDQYDERRLAVFVWRTEEDVANEGPEGLYLAEVSRAPSLARPRLRSLRNLPRSSLGN